MPDLLWLIGTNTSQNLKRFPEIKIHPGVQNTSQNTKICPRIQNTSQNVKTLPRIQNASQNPKLFWILGCVLDFGKCFWILGSVLDSGLCFGFWEVFWILGSVLSLRATADISDFPHEYVLVKLSPPYPPYGFSVFTVFNAGGLHHVNRHGGFPR